MSSRPISLPNDNKVVYLVGGETSLFILSLSTLKNHIINNHRLNFAGVLNGWKSPFLTETLLVPLIEFVLREGKVVFKDNGPNLLVEYHFDSPIGVTKKDRPVHWVRVAVSREGRVLTAYPNQPCSALTCDWCYDIGGQKTQRTCCYKDHITKAQGKE